MNVIDDSYVETKHIKRYKKDHKGDVSKDYYMVSSPQTNDSYISLLE